MTDVKKPNQITPTENKNGAEDMNRKVSFKSKKSKIDLLDLKTVQFWPAVQFSHWTDQNHLNSVEFKLIGQ